MSDKTTRRDFLITSAAVAGGIVGCNSLQQNTSSNAVSIAQKQNTSSNAAPPAKMPEQILGKTGVKVPIFGLGGAGQTPLSRKEAERDAVAQIEKALQLGITYFDTAASYGPSEDYLGKVLPPHRKKIFLASKTAARDRDGAWRELEKSLKRLNVDYLDLWQLHHVSFSEELDTIFSNSGAIKAIEEAKQQKLIRFAGITGHHEPDIIADGLRRYPFDHTLIPVNAADKYHPRPFLPVVLPVAREKNVGVTAMKVPAYGRLFKPGGLSGMQQALGYSLSQQGVHCCIVAAENIKQLEENVNVARSFQKLDNKQLVAIEKQVAGIWEDGNFFRAWT